VRSSFGKIIHTPTQKMSNTIHLRIFTPLLFALAIPQGHAALIYSSSEPGTFGGQPSGFNISSTLYIGWRFEVSTPVTIDTIGVGMYRGTGSTGIFSISLVSLATNGSLPSGSPFTPGELLLQESVSHGLKDYGERQFLLSTPISLSAGAYGLVLSTTSSNAGTLPNSNSDYSGTSYFTWNGSGWQNGGVSNVRLAAYGVPEPSTLALAFPTALFLVTMRRRSKKPNKAWSSNRQ
jgi:hypothetical protein